MCLWRLFFQPWHLTQFGPIAFSSRSLAAPRHLLFCRRRRSRTRTRPAQVRWKIGAQLDLCIRDLAAVHVAWRVLHAFTKGAFVFTGTLNLKFLKLDRHRCCTPCSGRRPVDWRGLSASGESALIIASIPAEMMVARRAIPASAL